MSDRPAWGTPPGDPSAGSGPADALPVDDRIDELYASVVDTGTSRSGGTGSRSGGTAPSGRGRVAVALVGVLVVCAVAGWLVLRPGATGSSSSGTSETERVTQSDVWAADSTPRLIDDLVEVVGGTQFTRIYLHADSVTAVAPTTPGATTTDRFSWRDGHAERSGPEGLLDADELFDVTTVDWTAIEGFVARASELSGIDGRPSSVDVDRAVDGGASAAAKLSFYMSDDYGRSARITADEKGQIVWMDGDIEGSPAFEWEAAGLHQTERLQQVMAEVVEVAGTTQFESVHVNRTSISADAVAVPEGSTIADVAWRGGFASVESTNDAVHPDELFDITTVDWTLIEGLVAQARDLTGIAQPWSWVSVERPSSRSSVLDVVFTVWVNGDSDDSASGRVVFDMAGQVVSMGGGAPGSASQEWEATH